MPNSSTRQEAARTLGPGSAHQAKLSRLVDRLRASDRRYLAGKIRSEHPDADAVIARFAPAWGTVEGLLEADGRTSYFPVCRIAVEPALERLADIFDCAMRALSDTRRALRVGTPSDGQRAPQ